MSLTFATEEDILSAQKESLANMKALKQAKVSLGTRYAFVLLCLTNRGNCFIISRHKILKTMHVLCKFIPVIRRVCCVACGRRCFRPTLVQQVICTPPWAVCTPFALAHNFPLSFSIGYTIHTQAINSADQSIDKATNEASNQLIDKLIN